MLPQYRQTKQTGGQQTDQAVQRRRPWPPTVHPDPGVVFLDVGPKSPVRGIVEQIDRMLNQDDRDGRKHQPQRMRGSLALVGKKFPVHSC